jgi:hypothetical protein
VERANDGGNGTALPWATVFDPAANVRALSSIQADGLRAASELVDRFIRIAAKGLNGNGSETPPAAAAHVGDPDADLFGASGLEPLVTSWWSMVDRFLQNSVPHGAHGGQPTSASLDLASVTATGEVRLEAAAPGGATTEVWLHNGGPADLGEVRLRCGDLLAHDGATIPARQLRFDPDVVSLPPRSSRGVDVDVDVGEHVAPGGYRGLLLANGYPDLWVPIHLVVHPRSS